MINRISFFTFLSSFFLVGFLKGAGTIASVLSFILIIYFNIYITWTYFFLFFFFSVLCYKNIETKKNSTFDPSWFVLDECLGILLLFLLFNIFDIGKNYSLLALVLFRFFDISKVFYISSIENIKGWIGVFGDDLLAAIYSFLTVFFLYCCIK